MSSSFTEDLFGKYEVMTGINMDFNFGKNRSKNDIDITLSKKRQTLLRKSQLVSRLIRTYREAKLLINSNINNIESLLKIKKHQENILKIENKRFKNGKITTLDFVKLQEAFDFTNLQIVNFRYMNELTIASLYQMLGRVDIYLTEVKAVPSELTLGIRPPYA